MIRSDPGTFVDANDAVTVMSSPTEVRNGI
jgi:hypothetical protein